MREKVHGRTPRRSAIQLRRIPRLVISRVSGLSITFAIALLLY
jgi:hypothetical protein